MRILKLMLISAVVLFLILTAFASLLPSAVRISRAMDISALPDQVRKEITDLRNWQHWNEYVTALAQKTVTMNRITSDELTVTRIDTSAEMIQTSWQQKDGKSFPGNFRLIANGSQTTVQWYFEFHVKWYPWEKFGTIIYDKQLGPVMENSLRNLKQQVER
jgi:hypothetical protein